MFVHPGDASLYEDLDAALRESPAAAGVVRQAQAYRRLQVLPFDHDRRMVSVLLENASGARRIVTKGAPEVVFARATSVPEDLRDALEREFAAGNRVVAIAGRPAPAQQELDRSDERDLEVRGLLVFLDPPKPSARTAIARLCDLGVATKVVTDTPA